MARKQIDRQLPSVDELLARQATIAEYEARQKEEAQKIDCSSLKSLPKPELIAIIQRMNAAMGNVAGMTDEQIAEAMLLKLATNALTTKDAKDCLANVNAWLDRKQGKAVQNVKHELGESFFERRAKELGIKTIEGEFSPEQGGGRGGF